jgi:opacity protein-like surface antigen
MKRYGFILLLIFLPSLASAQLWKRYRKQVFGGVGVTNFLGDLGGGNDIGVNDFTDLDIAATRMTVTAGFKYQLTKNFSARANLTYGLLRGDDKFTKEQFRRARDLHFRSNIWEASIMGELYLLQNSRNGAFRLRGVRGNRALKMDIYLLGGIGFMYFNPKGQLDNGDWVALQPIGTEGQGLPGQKDKYSRTTLTVPLGIGVAKTINRYWSVGIEFVHRVTFTDYIDDVGGLFYNPDAIINANGGNEELRPLITSSNGANGIPGEIRGDSEQNDHFMTGTITVTKKLLARRRSRPKF